MTEINGAGTAPKGTLLRVFPHLAARGVTTDTECQIYREYKPQTDSVEYSIFFRAPGEAKWRIDATVSAEHLAELSDAEDPENVVVKVWTVTYMGPAATAYFSVDDEHALKAIRSERLAELIRNS